MTEEEIVTIIAQYLSGKMDAPGGSESGWFGSLKSAQNANVKAWKKKLIALIHEDHQPGWHYTREVLTEIEKKRFRPLL